MGVRRRLRELEDRLAALERREVSYEMPPRVDVELRPPAALDVDPWKAPTVPIEDEDDERRSLGGVYL